jgi:prepilin-type N-terminal cleavage/methylation domain-containing protein
MCKSNRAFSLLEVLITAAILSSAVIFIFRAFAASLSAAKFSQNITLGCFLSEAKIWEISQQQKDSAMVLGRQQAREGVFNWEAELSQLEELGLAQLDFKLSWKEKAREADYVMDFLTYLREKK